MESLALELTSLCEKADAAYNEEMQDVSFESVLIEILNYVKSHPEGKEEHVKIFQNILVGGPLPIEIVEFTMRELRWFEIKNFVIEKLNSSDHPILCNGYRRILDVYEDEWINQDLYEYYN